MSGKDAVEAAFAHAVIAGARACGWRRSLALGASIGSALRALGVRRAVAERNLALAFPERGAEERAAILRGHYRELGRVAVEYARLGDLAQAAPGEVVAEVRGREVLETVRARGRGAILLSAHYGNFELLGAALGRDHPVDFVVRALRNPVLDAWLARERTRAGVGLIPANAGVRRVYEALRAGRWVAVLGDQDARRNGVFVPFFGRPASTPTGPARLALATGAPIVMGRCVRLADGRHVVELEPALEPEDPRAPDAVERLTARFTAVIEGWIRREPEPWFWLHRRWKSSPPAASAGVADSLPRAS